MDNQIAALDISKEEKSLAQKGSSKSKTIAIAAIAVVVIAVVVLALFVVVPSIRHANTERQNAADYAAAEGLLAAGDYEGAARAFTALGDWSDAAAQATSAQNEADYIHAIALYDAGDYETARQMFSSLGNYKDASSWAVKAQSAADDEKYGDAYEAALALFDAGKWEEAYQAFKALGTYKDSALLCRTADSERVNSPKYAAAEQLLASGDVGGAYLAFRALGSYSDSAARAAAALRQVKVGSYIRMGSYEQDNNTSNGKEALEWLVLANDGSRVLLLCRYGIDCQPYNSSYNNSWSSSSLKKWLESDFTTNAGLRDANGTVSLLSMSELATYLTSTGSRITYPTAYAKAHGAWQSARNAGCYYWLKDATYYLSSGQMAVVHNNGTYGDPTYSVTQYDVAVRPAIWITL